MLAHREIGLKGLIWADSKEYKLNSEPRRLLKLGIMNQESTDRHPAKPAISPDKGATIMNAAIPPETSRPIAQPLFSNGN